jgi:hypothetical protein
VLGMPCRDRAGLWRGSWCAWTCESGSIPNSAPAAHVGLAHSARTAHPPPRTPRIRSGAGPWPPKSSLYLFRTDGMSCSRELVTGERNGGLTGTPGALDPAGGQPARAGWSRRAGPSTSPPVIRGPSMAAIRTLQIDKARKAETLHGAVPKACANPVARLPLPRHRAHHVHAPDDTAAAAGVARPAQNSHGYQEAGQGAQQALFPGVVARPRAPARLGQRAHVRPTTSSCSRGQAAAMRPAITALAPFIWRLGDTQFKAPGPILLQVAVSTPGGSMAQQAAAGWNRWQQVAAGRSRPQHAAAGRSRPQPAAAGRSRQQQAAAGTTGRLPPRAAPLAQTKPRDATTRACPRRRAVPWPPPAPVPRWCDTLGRRRGCG